MADTTPDRVKSIAQHLSHVDDTVIQMYIEDAQTELSGLKVSAQYVEKLQRYLTAHLATLDNRRVSGENIGGALQSSYNSSIGLGLDGTEYGQEYKRLLRNAQGASFKVF